MPIRLRSLLSTALLLACRSVPPPPVVDFRPSGTVQVSTTTKGDKDAAFGPDRVVAPGLDVRRGADGRWTGTVGGATGDLEVTPGRIVGPGIDVAIRRAAGTLDVRGTVGGRRVEATLSDKGFGGWSDAGRCQFAFLPVGGGQYRGAWGCPTIPVDPFRSGMAAGAPAAELRLGGDAALDGPPSPQLELALLSVLPPY